MNETCLNYRQACLLVEVCQKSLRNAEYTIQLAKRDCDQAESDLQASNSKRQKVCSEEVAQREAGDDNIQC